MKSWARRLAFGIGLALAQRALAEDAFEAVLAGSSVVPGPGVEDGKLTAVLLVEGTRVTLTLAPKELSGRMAAHIHRGRAGVAGRLVAEFPWTPSFGRPLKVFGTVSERDAADLVAHPGNYYVDVHTQIFPAGAARGQLAPRSPGAVDEIVEPEAAEKSEAAPLPAGPVGPGLAPQAEVSSVSYPVIGLWKERIVKLEQRIAGAVPERKTYLDPDFPVGLYATSGLDIVFDVEGDCTVSRSTVHLTGAGSCALTTHQPGDSKYLAAPIIDVEFPIDRAEQTLDFPEITSGLVYGPADLFLGASASSGLPVSFSASGPCVAAGASLRLFDTGTCSVTAIQGGGRNFNPAPSVTRTVSVYVPPPPPPP